MPNDETKPHERVKKVASPRKAYVQPAIIYSERIEARAMVCAKVPGSCVPGPANS